DERGRKPSEDWTACYQPFFDAQHGLANENGAIQTAAVEAKKARQAVEAKAKAEYLALNPEEDALYQTARNAIQKRWDACQKWAEDVGACGYNCTPEIFQAAGGSEEQTRRGNSCLEKSEGEEQALNDKYPHAIARLNAAAEAKANSGPTFDDLVKLGSKVLDESDNPCASTGYICKKV